MDLVKVDPFQVVAASSPATVQFEPEGPASLHGFIFRMQTNGADFTDFNFLDDVDLLKLKHSGKDLLGTGITGARLTDINEYDGLVADPGAAAVPNHFFLGFGDPTARTARGQHLGNFDFTAWPGKMTIEARLGATAGGVDTPILDCWAVLMPPKAAMGFGYTPGEVALHRAQIETILQPSAAVQRKAFDIGLGSSAGALVKRLFMFHTNITELQVKRSGFDIYEDVPNDLAAFLQDDVFARVPQSGLVVWDPLVDGNYSEVKGTVNPATGAPYNYQVRLTTSDADTITVLADVLTNIRRL